MLRRILVLATTVLIAGACVGCGDTDDWVLSRAATGWPAQYATAENSSYSATAGPDALRLDWIRSVKGEVAAQVALGSDHYLAVNGQTAAGCSLMVWENDNRARQRWCTRLSCSRTSSTPDQSQASSDSDSDSDSDSNSD